MRIAELWKEAGLPDGRSEHGHHQPQRSGNPAQAPGDQGRDLRRLDQRRAAHLLYRRRQRQARAGADRSQEPRPGDERLRDRAHRAGHHQLVLRMRRRALHGAARGGGRERGRRRVGRGRRAHGQGRSTSARPTTRAPDWARWSTRGTRSSSSTGSRPAIKEGAKLVLDGRKPKLPRRMRKGILRRPDDLRPRDRRDVDAAARRSSARCSASSAWTASKKGCRS